MLALTVRDTLWEPGGVLGESLGNLNDYRYRPVAKSE